MTQERRNSYRCPVRSAAEIAVLRTRSRDLVARVLEESAGGYAILVESQGDLAVGQILSIAHKGGCYEVRTAHITEIQEGVRVGLQRRGELRFLHSQSASHWLRENRRGLALCAALVVVVCGLMKSGMLSLEKVQAMASAVMGAEVKPPQAPNHPFPKVDKQQREKLLATNYLQLGKLKSLHYSRELNLTSSQQFKIGGIVEQTSQALADLFQQREHQDPEVWSDQGLQLLAASWDDIQAVMTDEQRAKWRQIVAAEQPAPQ